MTGRISTRIRSRAYARDGVVLPRSRRWLAWVLVGALLSLEALVSSPSAHHALHKDAGHGEHLCAVTLAQAGFCDTATPVLAAPVVVPLPWACVRVPEGYQWRPPHRWHEPANGPPTV